MRTCLLAIAALGLSCVGTERAEAQQGAPATTVQLPTFNFFTVSTSVSVPDRGGVALGGVNRSSSGSNAFGPPLGPKNRSIGVSNSASTMSVHVQIHDLRELDRQVLGHAAGLPQPALNPKALAQVAEARQSTAGQGAASIAEIRAAKAAEHQEEFADAVKYIEKGQAAQVAGKDNVARLYYETAARRCSGELREQVLQRIAMLEPSASQTARP